jgi:hypothetical protein
VSFEPGAFQWRQFAPATQLEGQFNFAATAKNKKMLTGALVKYVDVSFHPGKRLNAFRLI